MCCVCEVLFASEKSSNIVAPEAMPEKIAETFHFTEGPTVDRNGDVYFVDMLFLLSFFHKDWATAFSSFELGSLNDGVAEDQPEEPRSQTARLRTLKFKDIPWKED